MLIFILPSWYKTKQKPGNCIFIYEQAQALRNRGNEVVVLNVAPVSVKECRLATHKIQKSNDNGIKTYYTEILSFYPSKLRAVYVKQFETALMSLLTEAIHDFGKPDVLYAHFSYPAGYIGTKISKRIQVPIVVEEHYSALMEKDIDRKLIPYIRETAKNCQSFLCVSSGLKTAVESIVDQKLDNIYVVSNMINSCFSFIPERKTESFVFFSLGGLIKRKRFDLLIDAFCEEFSHSEKVSLRIAGSGEEYENLNKMIMIRGDNRIKLLGQIDRNQTLYEYANCNCFVLASQAETYGLVYREALAVGRPIITTKHGGFDNDNWHPEYGLQIDVDDKKQLRCALRTMFTSFNCDNRRISEMCLNECSEESIAKQVESYLENAKETFKGGSL